MANDLKSDKADVGTRICFAISNEDKAMMMRTGTMDCAQHRHRIWLAGAIVTLLLAVMVAWGSYSTTAAVAQPSSAVSTSTRTSASVVGSPQAQLNPPAAATKNIINTNGTVTKKGPGRTKTLIALLGAGVLAIFSAIFVFIRSGRDNDPNE